MRFLSVVSTTALVLALTTAGSSTTGAREQMYAFQHEDVLGTSLDLKFAATSRAQAERAEAAVLKEIARESSILSSWDPQSEFSRWTRTHNVAVPVSNELFEVLGLYDQWRERTQGALNASAGTVIDTWKNAAKQGRTPSNPELTAAVAKASETQWLLDAAHQTAIHTGDASLVLASFTKSYIIDHAAAAAMHEGVTSAVINIGGDIAVRGALVEPVGIADPRSDAENSDPISEVRLHNLAIATSGDYRRGLDINGHHYSHIVDPRTGMPAEDVISSTVVAPKPADAGALATAFSILSPEESAKLAASMPGVQYLLVKKNGERIESRGWGSLESPAKPVTQIAAVTKPVAPRLGAAPAVAAGAPWDASMELSINFDLAPIGGTTKRPFVAAWIEDADHFQVRTLGVWYHEDRWVTEMKAWFRSDRLRAMAEGKEIFRSISAATRPPGKYSFKWDGKDNDGKVVKAGKYYVNLEVVREHGTYQLMKQEMDLAGTPKVVNFPANTEVVASSFDYHKLAGK
jgi:thiamine biosynthesis lipoprotein ApbE